MSKPILKKNWTGPHSTSPCQLILKLADRLLVATDFWLGPVDFQLQLVLSAKNRHLFLFLSTGYRTPHCPAVDLDVFARRESWEMIESSHIQYRESVL
jgi:hypothetical protein